MSSPVDVAKRELARAFRSKDPNRVKMILLSPEADLAWLDKPLERDGGCALHIGLLCDQEASVLALLEFGCDPNVINQNGETPLHVAAEQRLEHMIDLLVDVGGIRLDAVRKIDGRTALHIAAAHGCPDGVRRLLEAGASVDAKDRDGNTAVFLAVQNNRHRVVQELIAHGANPKLTNNSLQTCMTYAMKQSQDKAMIRLLLDRKLVAQAARPQAVRPNAAQLSRTRSVARQPNTARQEPQDHMPSGFLQTESQRPVAAVSLRNQWPQHQQQPTADLVGQQVVAASFVAPNSNERQQYQHRKTLRSAGVQVGGTVSDSDDDEASYPMDSKTRGLCIIINNQDYFNSEEFKERAGTELDERRLEQLFKSLRFHVKIFKNLDAKDIYWNLSNYAKSDHSRFDCYVCCILAHGNLGGIYGVDGKVQKLADLTVMLSSTNCPSLAGKPKIFIIQACRGSYLQHGVHFDRHHTRDMIQMANHETDALTVDEQQEYILPDHGDFLIGYATVAQHIAQRHREQGSVYVQTLCDVIERDRRKEDLLSMLTKVKYRVSKHVFHNEDGSVFVQMPEVKETLRKKIYFK